MEPLPLSPGAKRLIDGLKAAEHHQKPRGRVLHVASHEAGFYFAYEQLRKAAAYRGRHLLLRTAIERSLARDVSLREYEPIGAVIDTELTLSGYLKNDTIPLATIEQIDELLARSSQVYLELLSRRIESYTAAKWLLQYASVQIEHLLIPNPKTTLTMQYA